MSGSSVVFAMASRYVRPMQKLPSFPRGRESITKMQLGRLRIMAHYRRSIEFCKGLLYAGMTGVLCKWLLVATPKCVLHYNAPFAIRFVTVYC